MNLELAALAAERAMRNLKAGCQAVHGTLTGLPAPGLAQPGPSVPPPGGAALAPPGDNSAALANAALAQAAKTGKQDEQMVELEEEDAAVRRSNLAGVGLLLCRGPPRAWPGRPPLGQLLPLEGGSGSVSSARLAPPAPACLGFGFRRRHMSLCAAAACAGHRGQRGRPHLCRVPRRRHPGEAPRGVRGAGSGAPPGKRGSRPAWCAPTALASQPPGRLVGCRNPPPPPPRAALAVQIMGHPDPLVETASLASIALPAPNYEHSLHDLVANRALSDAQLESVVYANMKVRVGVGARGRAPWARLAAAQPPWPSACPPAAVFWPAPRRRLPPRLFPGRWCAGACCCGCCCC